MQTIAAIKKDKPTINLETELIVFNDRLLELQFIRGWHTPYASRLRVVDHLTGEVLADNPWTGGLGSAIVKDGVIHVFGTTNWSANGNKIIRSTLDANYAPSTPVDALLVNSPFIFFNTSVCEDSNGYRMVVETSVGVYFARSTDLASWNFYGGQLGAGGYCACPTIDYIDGVHYLTYLKNASGNFVTQVAKSTNNCFSFSYFNGKGVNPAGSYLLVNETERDGVNASDASFAEFNGKVYGVYLNGDQSTWGDSHRFEYNGTLAQLFAEFF